MHRLIQTAFAATVTILTAATPALAHPHHHARYVSGYSHSHTRNYPHGWRAEARHEGFGEGWFGFGGWNEQPVWNSGREHNFHSRGGDPRPAEWCAWYMRQVLGIPLGVINNLALSFLHYGHATSPHQGAVVVWSHGHGHGHVGQITGGQCGQNRWIITSGNDSHAVRTRCRSVAGAVGFREG